MNSACDLFIIGGGINGTAIAADAAGRGLSIILCEKEDLSSGTSSKSSKLIHGGLRYLELYEFGLVRKALHEREVLMMRAPQLITPLEFVLPHESHLRPLWMIKIGLFLYDHLAKRHRLPASKSLHLLNDIRGKELLSHLKKGFSYFDCYTDDTKLVILNALSAKQHNATILTRTEFLNAYPDNNYWKVQLKNTITNEIFY
ncbi:MAG: FAD-dependent oxidoreductase, partial [Gammaproteobacteria bacterium]|nr:FAD-dependent oxidoreductase [Gammaproteobacteria bacterium]